MKKFKWAILGPGTIAHKFADGLSVVEDAEIHAVGEIEQFYDRAVVFAESYAVQHVYKGVEALCEDEEIDAVYISMINTKHIDAVLTCLNAGKNVLCEKPIGINQEQLEEMTACAWKNDVFLMEAFWSNFLPAVVKAKEWLAAGVIGEVKSITADFGFKVADRSRRHFNKALGGGVLLDVGTYTIGMPLVFMGEEPESVSSDMYICEQGVDETDTILMKYRDGKFVRIHNTFSSMIRHDFFVYGTEGYIHIPDFWHAPKARLYVDNQLKETFYEPFKTTGYNFEAEEVMKCIREGKKQSDIMPLSLSMSILKIMDEVREQGGLKYDCENAAAHC